MSETRSGAAVAPRDARGAAPVGRGPFPASLPELLLLATLALCALYYLYRYPLRLNDVSTSPTYDATPFSLQVGKYLFLALLAGAAGVYALLRRRAIAPSGRELLLVGLAVFVSVRAGVAYLGGAGFDNADLVAPLAAAVPVGVLAGTVLARDGGSARLGRLAVAFAAGLLVAHAAANLVQIALWTAFDRLPALGYENTLLVRFGGLWDDPNSSGAYAAGVLVVLASGRVPLGRRALLLLAGCGLFNLVVSQSFSAAVLLAVGLFAVGALRMAGQRWSGLGPDVLALAAALAAAAALVGLALLAWPVIVDLPVLERVLSLKEESLRLRLEGETYFTSPGGPVEWLVGTGEPEPAENAYGNWLSASGVLGLALLVAALVWTVRSTHGSPEFGWVAPLVLGAGVASVFVPYLNVFPVATLLLLAAGLAASRYERPLRAPPAAAP